MGIGNMHNLISKTTLALILSAIYRATFSVYKDQTKVPCEAGQNLMSPAVGTLRLLLFWSRDKQTIMTTYFSDMKMNTWSECTRKMIDSEYDRREEKKKNCFYT